MKNSNKFWFTILFIIISILTIFYFRIMISLFLVLIAMCSIIYVVFSLLAYNGEEKHRFLGNYNMLFLIFKFNKWLDNKNFNNLIKRNNENNT